MAFTDYASLKSAVKTHSDRTDIGDDVLSDLVTLAEARIRKDLSRHEIRVREMETRSDLTPTSGACPLPDDFMAMKAAQTRATNPTVLTYRPIAWCNEAYPDGDSGTPAFYSIEGDQLYMFPLTSSDIRIVYWAYPAALSDTNDTNWLLDKYPDIYLHACLLEVRIFDEDEEGMQFQQSILSAAFDGLDKSRFGALASRPTMASGMTPA